MVAPITVFSTTIRVGAEAELIGYAIIKDRFGHYHAFREQVTHIGGHESVVPDSEDCLGEAQATFRQAFRQVRNDIKKRVETLAELYTV